MRLSVKLTLDGMIRALRWKAHALAEDAEHGYRDAEPPLRRGMIRKSPLRREETENDRRE